MDPLSEVLALLKPKGYRLAGLEAAGKWAIQFHPMAGLKFQTVMRGQAWLTVRDVPEPILLREGDCFLLPRGWPFRLGSDLKTPAVDAGTLFPPKDGRAAKVNGGGEFVSGGSLFVLEGADAALLVEALPPVVLVRGGSELLHWMLERMGEEVRGGKPGGMLMADHMAHMILVETLRLHVAEVVSGSGWLSALSDPQIARALKAMHADLGRRWTLGKLASEAGMSRSGFAGRFKERAGTSPMEHLTRWRMAVAADRLMDETVSLVEIADQVGYASESAFSLAFKRTMGTAPRRFIRQRRAEERPRYPVPADHSA